MVRIIGLAEHQVSAATSSFYAQTNLQHINSDKIELGLVSHLTTNHQGGLQALHCQNICGEVLLAFLDQRGAVPLAEVGVLLINHLCFDMLSVLVTFWYSFPFTLPYNTR